MQSIATGASYCWAGRGPAKSSYLQYLALVETAAPVTTARLPLLVDLNAWDSSGSFLSFVQAFLRDPPNPAPPEAPVLVVSPWLADRLEGYLQAGRVLLLLDGLNELPQVGATGASARQAALQAFFAAYPHLRAVVTCRMLDYGDELATAAFQPVLLDPWTVEQMALYLQGCGAPGLLARLQAGDPLLLSLGQVPFLLYMLTELAANTPPPVPGAPDPLASGSALFRRFMDLLLEWATKKTRPTRCSFRAPPCWPHWPAWRRRCRRRATVAPPSRTPGPPLGCPT